MVINMMEKREFVKELNSLRETSNVFIDVSQDIGCCKIVNFKKKVNLRKEVTQFSEHYTSKLQTFSKFNKIGGVW